MFMTYILIEKDRNLDYVYWAPLPENMLLTANCVFNGFTGLISQLVQSGSKRPSENLLDWNKPPKN